MQCYYLLSCCYRHAHPESQSIYSFVTDQTVGPLRQVITVVVIASAAAALRESARDGLRVCVP